MKNIKISVTALLVVAFGIVFVINGCGPASPDENPDENPVEKLKVAIRSEQNLTGLISDGSWILFSTQIKEDGNWVNEDYYKDYYSFSWSDNNKTITDGDPNDETLDYQLWNNIGTHKITVFITDKEDGTETNASITFNVAPNPDVAKLTEAIVGVALNPGEKAALGDDGMMHKTNEQCPRNQDETILYQSTLQNHYEHYIDLDAGEDLLIYCSANSPFKIKVNGMVRDDYTLLSLSPDGKTARVHMGGTKEDDGTIGFYGGFFGLAWSVADTNSLVLDDYRNEYHISRDTVGDTTTFKSFYKDVHDTESNSTQGLGITSFEEHY